MQAEFRNHYNYNIDKHQFVFIDNAVFTMDEEDLEEEEKEKFHDALDDITVFTSLAEPFLCRNIEEVMKERDELLKAINKL